MKRIIKILLGLLCAAAACWSGILAFGMFKHIVLPTLTGGAKIMDGSEVIYGPFHHLQVWMVYVLPPVLGLASLGLIIGGWVLLVSKSHDGHDYLKHDHAA